MAVAVAVCVSVAVAVTVAVAVAVCVCVAVAVAVTVWVTVGVGDDVGVSQPLFQMACPVASQFWPGMGGVRIGGMMSEG